MPTTLVHGLLPAACLWFSRATLPKLKFKEWLVLLFTSCVIANLPDLDLVLALFDPGNFLKYHRWVGHNIFTLTAFFFLARRILGRICPPLSLKQRSWIVALLLASHAAFDAMGGGGGVEIHERHGTPLFWPISEWQLNFPFVLFPRYAVSHDSHFLVGHLLSGDYWTRAILSEFMVSVLLLTIWVAGFHTTRISYRLLKVVSGKKDFAERLSPLPLFSRQYNPKRPSRLRQDGSQPRKGRGSSQGF